MLGYSYYQSGNDFESTRYFELASKTENPYQEDARYYRSVIYYKNGEHENALTAFEELADSPKYASEIKVYQASSLLKLGRLDELNTLAEQILTKNRIKREEAEIFYIAANSSFEREDYPRTTSYYGEFIRKQGAKKMTPTDYFRMGYSHYKQNEYEDAIKPLELAQKGVDSLSMMSSYYLGFCFLEEKDPESAKFAFRKAATGDAKINETVREDALYQYAKVAFATADYDEALKAMEFLRKRYPRAPYMDEIRGLTGEIYLYTRDYKRYIQFFESAPLNSPRARQAYQTVCYFYGLELYEEPDYPQAASYLQKAIDNPFDQEMTLNAQYWKAEALFRQGEFKSARSQYQKFIQARGSAQNEYYSRAFYGQAWTYFKEQNYAQALRNFQEFLNKGGNRTSKGLVVDANLRAGDCLFLQKKYAEANPYYQRVIDLRYTYRDYAAYQMAEGFYRRRDYQSSVNTFDRMIRTFSKSELRDNALDRISDIYVTWLKDYGQAAKYASILVKEYPRSPLAAAGYNRLAQAVYNQGNESEAIRHFKKVLTDYGGDRKNAQIALDNLANLLPEREFDRVLADYRKSNPTMDNNLAALVFNTGKDRFFSGNYNSAIDQFGTYIRDYRNGQDYFESLIFRARSYKEIGQYSSALKDYQDVYDQPVNNDFTGIALQEAAEIRYEQKNYAASLQLFQQLELVSGNLQNKVQALFGLAKNHKALAQYAQAINALEQISINAEVQAYSRTKAAVELGQCQYLMGDLNGALQTFQNVEAEYKNAFGAESQFMITQIFYDQGVEAKDQGQADQATALFNQAKDATIYMKNNYPTENYWKAKTFFVAANAFYELGNTFQAKGTLESLINEDRFPDVQEAARERLAEIEASEDAFGDGTGQ
ncbi:MAG: tetratricopeptide repeat protein [Bacteroidota bacterium]